MATHISKHFERVLCNLVELGFLLESDPRLPSVCSIITGEAMRGSWWSHPMAQAIFQVNQLLEDHPDVLITKLVSGKVTFVYREFWPEIVSIGTAREDWQTSELTAAAKWLLEEIDGLSSIRTDQINPGKLKFRRKPGDIARELERKLLTHADQVHTESGAHAKILETWQHWAQRSSFESHRLPSSDAKRLFETKLTELNAKFSGKATLPWIS